MLYKSDISTQLPVSAASLIDLLHDPERLLRVSVEGKDIRQNAAGDWEGECNSGGSCLHRAQADKPLQPTVTDKLSLLRVKVAFTTHFENTANGVITNSTAPLKVTSRTEWIVVELPAHDGQEHCTAREVTTLEAPWYIFPLVKAQKKKTQAAVTQRFVKELQEEEQQKKKKAAASATKA